MEDAKKNSKINRMDNANFLSGPAEDLIFVFKIVNRNVHDFKEQLDI